jgi:hypothetical protein
VAGVGVVGRANSKETSSFIPRRPRSPSSPSEELSWESSLCHCEWEVFSRVWVVVVLLRSNWREEGLEIMISRKCLRFRGREAENVKSPFKTSTSNRYGTLTRQ